MNTVFVFSFGILLVIIYYLCTQSEDFRIRHYTRQPMKRHLRPRQLQQRVSTLQRLPQRLLQHVPQQLQRTPQQGFPLGPSQ